MLVDFLAGDLDLTGDLPRPGELPVFFTGDLLVFLVGDFAFFTVFLPAAGEALRAGDLPLSLERDLERLVSSTTNFLPSAMVSESVFFALLGEVPV